jgi:hypothetical protein
MTVLEWIDHFIFFWAIFLLIVGLIFTASGFGIFVAGRLDGIILIISGAAMFWAGWAMSGARGLPCAAAAILNMFDAASTVAFWNFEVNPGIVAMGPTVFLSAKIASSLTIILYAKFHPNPRKGGILLSVFYAVVVGWNLSQNFRAYMGLTTFAYGIVLGAGFSLMASAAVLYAIFISGHISKQSVKQMSNKLMAAGLIGLLALSTYLVWDNNVMNNYYEELYRLYGDLSAKYNKLYSETIYEFTVQMPKGLDEHYERIRTYESGKFISKGNAGLLLFYATQVLHDLGNYSYDDHCANFTKATGTECANVTTQFAINFLTYVNRSYSSVSRVEQVYSWVNDFVSYVNDTEDFGRFPIETLVYRCGDCEDQAMALSFLLKSCGYETALCIVYDANFTQYSAGGFYHTFCVVRKNGFEYNGTVIQLYRYPQHGASWIVLDPTFNHAFGEDPEWMEHYRLQNATVYIPSSVFDAILVDYYALTVRAEEIEIIVD